MMKYSTSELAMVAEKFGNVPYNLTQKSQIVPEYLSEDEFAMLPFCPREGTVESCGKWPRIGGRKTYPLSGALSAEEKAAYNAFKKESRNGVTTPRATAKAKALNEKQLEHNRQIENLIQVLKAEQASEACVKAAESLLFREPDRDLIALLGKSEYDGSPVSRYALMFRAADGTRLPDTISAEEFAIIAVNGIKPVLNNEQLQARLNALSERGITLNII